MRTYQNIIQNEIIARNKCPIRFTDQMLDRFFKSARDDNKFAGEAQTVPYTPPALIAEINEKIPSIRDRCSSAKICVLYTVEWAITLEVLGFEDITLVTQTHDPLLLSQSVKYKYNYKTVEDIKDMKFDVVVGNPPYSITIPGGGRTAGTKKRLYAIFFHEVFNKADSYAVVLPSNWIGRQKDSVRKAVIDNVDVKWIYDTTDHFAGAIKGTPTCVVIKEKGYNSSIKLIKDELGVHKVDAALLTSLKIGPYLSIFEKLSQSGSNMSSIWRRNVNSGLTRSSKYITDTPTEYPVALVTGPNGQGVVEAFSTEHVKQKDIDLYKTIMNTNASISSIGAIKILPPGYYTTDSIVFFSSNNEDVVVNIKQYLESSIVRFIVKTIRNSHGNTSSFFSKVPTVDFTRAWSDVELYEHFNLTTEEIALVEETVR